MQLYVYNIITDEPILQQNFWNNRKQNRPMQECNVCLECDVIIVIS